MGIKQNFHHDQDAGERLLGRLCQFLQQFAKKLMNSKKNTGQDAVPFLAGPQQQQQQHQRNK